MTSSHHLLVVRGLRYLQFLRVAARVCAAERPRFFRACKTPACSEAHVPAVLRQAVGEWRAILQLDTVGSNRLRIRRVTSRLPPNPTTTSLFVNSRTLMGFDSKLPLPLYADVRLHIPMTHHHDRPYTLHVDRAHHRGKGNLQRR